MPARDNCRIVITGIGLCTPYGPDRKSTWQGMLSGKSVTRWLSPPHWPSEQPRLAGAPVRFPETRLFRHHEPLIELALTTAHESLIDAGLDSVSLDRYETGVVFGTSKGGLHTYTQLLGQPYDLEADLARGDLPANPGEWLDVLPNRAAVVLRQMIGGYGPVLCPVMACATGLAACLRGAELIRNGDCDLVLAGSADASLQPALLGSFRRLGVLSRELDDPASACRPYDHRRSGFVVGEGAACLILERLDLALERGATYYAEWREGQILSDANSLTQLETTGSSLKRLLSDLSRRTRIPDYINLHGTGTATNDVVECRAIREVFGDASRRIQCSSLKGGMGHLLGAAGSVELAATALAIHDQMIPPTVNLEEQDEDCRLNLTPQKARKWDINQAWKVSMGFGGHLAGVCLSRPESPQ
ncbi:beta-ketoacyl-[acyl-carrier-protein] synthase family protein [Schlesneria sp. T3-172]|uniref:beta-ketoacyl-[acyl-carrier-protein] synthase family protein n=1 Tax=Schlesneria sphaerica TaxID=3373610 RepID=UPI0037C9664F